jgi:hypothetical protein
MAIGSYYDVYDVDSYERRVSDISQSIASLSSGDFYFDARNQLIAQIDILKTKEQKLFNLLGVSSIEELNKALQEYREAVLNLSGAQLNEYFIGALQAENQKEFESFSKAVKDVVSEDLFNNEPLEKLGRDTIRDAILSLLNIGKKGTRYTSSAGIRDGAIFPSSFTKEQKNRWDQLLRQKYSHKKSAMDYISITANPTKGGMEAGFTWYDFTEEMTPTEAKERLTESQLENINRQVRQLVLSRVGKDGHMINEIMGEMLKENKYLFFVGKNVNQITGILGELQGIYYLAKLFQGDWRRAIRWRGGTSTGVGNTKPHQDILLKEFGIQVKNTTKESLIDMSAVDFSEMKLDSMLARAGISPAAADVFINYYGTLAFNVEYHRDRRRRAGSQYLPGLRMTDKNAKRFAANRAHLIALEKDIETLLSMFAAAFMYLDVSDQAQGLDTNVLFLLGGAAFYTASQVLTDVLEDLEREKRSFGVRASFSRGENIIAALNAQSRSPNFSRAVVNDIKLTSSFKF